MGLVWNSLWRKPWRQVSRDEAQLWWNISLFFITQFWFYAMQELDWWACMCVLELLYCKRRLAPKSCQPFWCKLILTFKLKQHTFLYAWSYRQNAMSYTYSEQIAYNCCGPHFHKMHKQSNKTYWVRYLYRLFLTLLWIITVIKYWSARKCTS